MPPAERGAVVQQADIINIIIIKSVYITAGTPDRRLSPPLHTPVPPPFCTVVWSQCSLRMQHPSIGSDL